MGVTLSTFALPNGLRVVQVQDPRASEVQVTMRYRVGAADDPDAEMGMAHVVEHLMFQQVLDDRSLFAHLEDIATSFNAATTYDATTFTARADDSRLEELLEIEAARLEQRCGDLTDPVFERERAVVRNELRERGEAESVLAAVHDGLYPVGHPYRRSVGGSEASVASITRARACAFADAHYAPGNAVLVVSGNIARPRLDQALAGSLGRATAREVATPVAVAAFGWKPAAIEAAAPIEDDMLVVGWPVPEDPRLRARVRAVAPALASLMTRKIKGRALALDLGDERSPMVAIALFPFEESTQDLLQAAQGAVAELPGLLRRLSPADPFDKTTFASMQRAAIYRTYASLEEGAERDGRLAGYVLAGLDPNAAIGDALQGLREITNVDAAQVATEHLGFDREAVVILRASVQTKRRRDVVLTAPIHDLGQPREAVDPLDAMRPLSSGGAPVGIPGARMRTLANGLQVVLLPVTSVPALDVRLVFRAGTADEPADRRGAALVAGYALGFDPKHLNDALGFVAAGGAESVDVGTDHTSFSARGVDSDLDSLLTGLRRWVRDGRYDVSSNAYLATARREAKRMSEEGALTAEWRAAVFGAHHPYVEAGIVRQGAAGLTIEEGIRFRAAHFAPDSATLVISGHFDPDLADRWIDFLFADWNGKSEPRSSARPRARPASLARAEATTQVSLRIALPAAAGHRAERLVAAAMLAEIAGDVRHQLGASYGLTAELADARLASNYLLAGAVDATRAAEVMELLRDRLAALGTDPDRAARVFVTARNRVLVRLASVVGTSTGLAERVERDVSLARPPLSELTTATEVRRLTLDAMAPTLLELDLSRAVILLRGPKPEVEHAFAVLGRTGTYVHPDPEQDNDDAPSDGLSPPTPKPRRPYTVLIGAGYASALNDGVDTTGAAATAQGAYRVRKGVAIGANVSITTTFGPMRTSLLSLEMLAAVELTYRRLWMAPMAGLLVRYRNEDKAEGWAPPGFGVALAAGVDLVGGIGVYARLDGAFISDMPYQALTIGLGYRW